MMLDSALPKPGYANYEKQANGFPEKCHHEKPFAKARLAHYDAR